MKFAKSSRPNSYLYFYNGKSTSRIHLQRGFSLVELIVVVAIIGILATLVTPMYGKVAHRARQSEAKIQLGALHTAEKSFYAEFSAYHTAFQAIGYAPEGNVRYNIGFGAYGVVADPANGYNSILPTWSISTRGYCAGVGGANVTGNSCNLLVGYDDLPAPPIPAVLTTYSDGYFAGAYIYTPAEFALLDDAVNNIENVAQLNSGQEFINGLSFGMAGLRGLMAITHQAFALSGGSVAHPAVCSPAYPCVISVSDSNPITSDIWMIDNNGLLQKTGPIVTCFSVVPTANSVVGGPAPGVDNVPPFDCNSDPRLIPTPVTAGGGGGNDAN